MATGFSDLILNARPDRRIGGYVINVNKGIQQQANHKRLHYSFRGAAISISDVGIIPTPRAVRVLQATEIINRKGFYVSKILRSKCCSVCRCTAGL
jgi:hypothetical protein